MQVTCNNQIITVDEIIASSKTLQNMIADVDNQSGEYPVIPSRYYEHLHTKLKPFNTIQLDLNLYNFLKTNQELIVNVSSFETSLVSTKLHNLKSELFENLESEILCNITAMIQVLELYDFLDVDENFINELAKEIGRLLEQINMEIEIIPQLLSIIIKQFPSLGYHPKYINFFGQPRDKLFVLSDILRYKDVSFYQIRNGLNITEEKIIKCCRTGNYEYIKYLSDNGLKLNTWDKRISLFLMLACASGNLELVRFILSEGAIIDINFLLCLCRCDNIEAIQIIFDNFCGEIPFVKLLETACSENNLKMLKYLISKGADIHSSSELLVNSAKKSLEKYSSIDIIIFLIENNYDINSSIDILLIKACKKNNFKLLDYLISKGIKINQPLIIKILKCACKENNFILAKYLISKKVDMTKKTIIILLNAACEENNLQLVKHLIHNGIELDHQPTPFSIYTKKREFKQFDGNIITLCKDNDDFADYLYQNGVDIHFNNNEALRSAVRFNYANMCKFLISKGADVHVNKEQCLIESIICIENFDTSIFKLLVQGGADINFRINDETIKYDTNTYHIFVYDPYIVNHVLNRDITECYLWVDNNIFCLEDTIEYKDFFSELVIFLNDFIINLEKDN
jgi:ankyrin repeat protein